MQYNKEDLKIFLLKLLSRDGDNFSIKCLKKASQDILINKLISTLNNNDIEILVENYLDLLSDQEINTIIIYSTIEIQAIIAEDLSSMSNKMMIEMASSNEHLVKDALIHRNDLTTEVISILKNDKDSNIRNKVNSKFDNFKLTI